MIVAQKPVGDRGGIGGGPMRRTKERKKETGQQNQLRAEYNSDVPPKMGPLHLPFFSAQRRRRVRRLSKRAHQVLIVLIKIKSKSREGTT
jgi:hypothetical protein